MKLVFATANPHKLIELKNLIPDKAIQLLSLTDFHISDIPETGKTFQDNALIKAKTVYLKVNCPVLADDSGLEIACLNNKPGIYSKRYAGEKANDKDRIDKVLKEMQNVPFYQRGARFVCSMVLYDQQYIFNVNGFCHGYITEQPKGTNGFGYDPIFYLNDLQQTMAQLSLNKKNIISHRANALKQVIQIISQYYEL